MYKIIGANQVEYGPVSAEQLRQWIAEGRVNAQTMAQAAGETTWKPISSFPEFAASFPGAAAGAAPPLTPNIPPTLGATGASPDGRARALDAVNGPAIGLIVTSGLGIAYSSMAIVGNLITVATGRNPWAAYQNMPQFQGQNQQIFQMMQAFSGVGGIVIELIKVALAIFIIFAALKMKKLENHGMAMVASILALIPCFSPCCCLGIPIGIWALIVLGKTEVKSFFT